VHGLGHWLGLDVHDVGAYQHPDGAWLAFKPGMVLTIEPGLYFPVDSNVAAKWRGIGIRIEDDILVTKEGCCVLTQNCPKDIADIELIMQN
jgi:Xaa-Pro aminopeptidase